MTEQETTTDKIRCYVGDLRMVLDSPIHDLLERESLQLSVRCRNALLNEHISTLRALASLTEAEFMLIPNVGLKTLAEANAVLTYFALRFGTYPSQSAPDIRRARRFETRAFIKDGIDPEVFDDTCNRLHTIGIRPVVLSAANYDIVMSLAAYLQYHQQPEGLNGPYASFETWSADYDLRKAQARA